MQAVPGISYQSENFDPLPDHPVFLGNTSSDSAGEHVDTVRLNVVLAVSLALFIHTLFYSNIQLLDTVMIPAWPRSHPYCGLAGQE